MTLFSGRDGFLFSTAFNVVDDGMMLNDFGKLDFTICGMSVHIFFGCIDRLIFGSDLRFSSAGFTCFDGITDWVTDVCELFGVIERLGVIVSWPLPTEITVDGPDL